MIVSNDHANQTAQSLGRKVLTVVPIASDIDRLYPFRVLLAAGTAGLKVEAKARAEQVRAVSISRIGQSIGQAPPSIIEAINQALRLHLALWTAAAVCSARWRLEGRDR